MEIPDLIATVLVAVGIALQILAVFAIRRLIWGLPSGRLRVRWRFLLAFVVIFVAG